jgi:hypothetical protein
MNGRTRLAAWVSVETKQRFGAMARQLGLTESALLKRMVDLTLQGTRVAETPFPTPPEKVARDARLYVRLRPVRSAIIGDIRRGTGILNNPVYKGEVVWGRSRWIRSPRDSAIRRCEVVEDPAELVTHSIERLRIVSDELWNAVHIVQSARTPRSEAIRAAKRRQGRGPALWAQ